MRIMSIVTAVLLGFSLPLQAEDRPYIGIGVVTGTMIGCSQAPRSDLSSHCYMGLISGTWSTIFTKNPYIGAAVGCLLGAAKEGYDRNNGGVADEQDFYYTCGAAAISSYGTDNLLKFYSINGSPAVRIQKTF